MTKRTLDTLFKSKLANAEVEVRPEAWHLLKERMNRKKGLVIWPYLYAAVATGAVFTIGWMLYPRTENPNELLSIGMTHADSLMKEEFSNAPENTESAERDTADIPVGPKPTRKKRSTVPSIHRYTKGYLADGQGNTIEQPAVDTSAVQHTLPLALHPQEQIPVHDSVLVPDIDTPITGISVTLALTDETDQRSTTTNEPVMKPAKKLWQQLKALRKGEEVSLKEIRQTGQQLIAGVLDSESE